MTAYVALGSNLGDRRAALDAAVSTLRRLDGVEVEAVSRAVETPPVGPPGQGPYLNAAVRLRTTLGPYALLRAMQAIERSLGRPALAEREHWGPRVIDLDLLLHGEAVIDDPDGGLVLPHPRMHERDFVLGPLCEVGSDACHPVLGRTAAELMAERSSVDALS
ncbi:MAG: 2-amino-4-hydroxy-6-hydroxymethyldihydropteridine diphosphokinase [Planctomycetota bacterium]